MKDYLEANVDDERAWWFYIASNAEDCKEQVEEMIKRIDGLYDAFGDFIIPTKVNIGYRFLPENLPLSDFSTVPGKGHPGKPQKKTFYSADGVEKSKLHHTIQDLKNQPVYIPIVAIKKNKVKLELESGTHYLGCSDPRYRYPNTNRSSGDGPFWEPIKPKKLHLSDRKAGAKRGFPFSYLLPVNLHTDIWFEDSELGQRNRQNLVEFLEAIETHLPVLTIRREPGVSAEQLKRVY